MVEKIYKKEIEDIVVLTGLNFEESLEAYSILGFTQIETYCYCKGSKWFRDTFHTGKNLIIKLDLTDNLKPIIEYRFKNISKNNDTVKLNTIKNVSLEVNRCGQRCREMLRKYSKKFIEWFDLNFNYEDKLLTPIKILYYYGGSTHTINAVLRSSYRKATVKDFINSKDSELLKLRELGIKGLEQTKIALLEYKDLNNLS